ncbi:MAG: dipeptidase [Clostridia bacterium]|nr:dipeptidase [Clostridia bacterium]
MIADFHNDILTSKDFTFVPSEYYKNNKVVTAIFNDGRSFSDALSLCDKSPLIAFEDIGYDDFNEEKMIDRKPIYVGLTWNYENRFAFGCKTDGKLKPEGHKIIKLLNARKIAVDTAHICRRSFEGIVDFADLVINSHTCFSRVYPHARNIEDWQIKAIIEKNGLIGLTCCGYFLTGDKVCEISDLIKQIDYFCSKFDYKKLCFGTDFFGTDFLPEGLYDYDSFERVFYELENLGYTRSQINAIWYENLNNFLEIYYGR